MSLEPVGPGLPARDTLEEKLELAAVESVTPHDETGQGILHQLGERAWADGHDNSPAFRPPEIHSSRQPVANSLNADRHGGGSCGSTPQNKTPSTEFPVPGQR